MKKFNIDSIEKKTPYSIPKDFFEEMQKNVISEIKKTSSEKLFSLKPTVITFIAAAFVIILGFTFFLKHTTAINSTTDQKKLEQPIISYIQKDNQQNNNTEKIDLNLIKKTKIAANSKKTVLAPSTPNVINQNNNPKKEDHYQQLLNSISEEEVAELAKNSDHDIYLELYN